ncbi:hypothetical protein Hore_18460 [Halothermothrix orenii H 168]|uniref:Uncharacterized protein n=2 Tax=Halothermothrix orenii TaxID=31909 RepID=B8CZ76_HALOH|nr:hypothetical protein Hore_18460 [Halothermothrix orenii H 168]
MILTIFFVKHIILQNIEIQGNRDIFLKRITGGDIMGREVHRTELLGGRHHKDRSCSNTFKQELLVEFEVTFNVDIENVNVTDVQCPGAGFDL